MPICCGGKKEVRGHTDLNHGPIGLQPIALPLSYIPSAGMSQQSVEPNKIATAGQLLEALAGVVRGDQSAGHVETRARGQKVPTCRDQDSNLGYCGHNAGY